MACEGGSNTAESQASMHLRLSHALPNSTPDMAHQKYLSGCNSGILQ